MTYSRLADSERVPTVRYLDSADYHRDRAVDLISGLLAGADSSISTDDATSLMLGHLWAALAFGAERADVVGLQR